MACGTTTLADIPAWHRSAASVHEGPPVASPALQVTRASQIDPQAAASRTAPAYHPSVQRTASERLAS
jgi:hypothetical protein